MIHMPFIAGQKAPKHKNSCHCFRCDRKSLVFTKEMRRKISEGQKGKKVWKGKDHYAWKGNNVGYDALHDWVQRELGKANKCEFCDTKTAKRYEWANKSHEYKRDLEDWVSLCAKCHKQYDRVGKKVWAIRRSKWRIINA